MQSNSLLPIHYLHHLVIAAPVWFLWSRNLEGNQGNDDPQVEGTTRYICDLGKTQRFADLFLMFNRRVRPFKTFEGDFMPPNIVELISEMQQHFDVLAIATPYHHIASREWADPNWASLIDPFLIGFKRSIPEVMFFLGRWSNTGIFPLVEDMVGDTVAFIRANVGKLNNFGENPYWYSAADRKNQAYCKGGTAHRLREFADELSSRFDKGTMFQFLATQ